MVKNLPANAGATGDVGSIPGSGRSPGGGHGNPLQYSCLENPMNGRSWWATVHEVSESATAEHTCIINLTNIDASPVESQVLSRKLEIQ